MNNKLPILDVIPDIKKKLLSSNRLVLQAPPGAGKTTSVPLELMNENWLKGKKIVMLEPRRIAVRNAAYWMAKTLNEKVGERVGYTIHLDKKVSSNTVIEVVTEGVFLRRLVNDPDLSDVGMVLLDEFHERSQEADLSLALLKETQEVLREDLKILIMSATLDAEPIAKFLDNAPIISSNGKSFPVNIKYMPPLNNHLVDNVVSAVIHGLNNEKGSILVFLPGVGEIKNTESSLKSLLPKDIFIQPLYGSLSREDQERAIEPTEQGERKVVLATSIAESSITIKGVRVVIDSGLVRTPVFNPRTGMDSLETFTLSKASADQRMGRAGRVEPGICYRLWNEHQKLDDYSTPGILNEDLTSLVLTLVKWGYRSIDDIKWVTKPKETVFNNSLRLLKSLGAVGVNGLTSKGDKLLSLPLHPRLANMVIEGEALGQKCLASDLAAILSERDFLTFPREVFQSDILLRLETLGGKSVPGASINRNGIKRTKEYSHSIHSGSRHYQTSYVSLLLLKAYPDRVAKSLGEGLYQLVNGSNAILSDADTLQNSEFLIIPSLGGTGKSSKIFMASAITKKEIVNTLRDNLVWNERMTFDKRRNKLTCSRIQMLGHIILKKEKTLKLSVDTFHKALCYYLKENGLKELNWSKEAYKFRNRIQFLNNVDKSKYPDFGDKALLSDLSWLLDYLGGISINNSLKDIPLLEALKGFFDYTQLKDIDFQAPTHIRVPSGSNIPIDYSTGEPVLKVRLQEIFGLIDTPKIANSKIPVIIHLLSPASRPIQITKDLKNFWDNTYYDVKKDLKGRYPKHYWPDDPLTAEPTNRVKRK